jgi:hypothetical protein
MLNICEVAGSFLQLLVVFLPVMRRRVKQLVG